MYVPKRASFRAQRTGSLQEDPAESNIEDIRCATESAAFLCTDENAERVRQSARDYAFRALKIIAADNESCLDRDILLHVARVTLKRNRGLLSLPFGFALFVLYAFSANQHEDVNTVHMVESGLRTALGHKVEDISTLEGTWAWLNGTLFPTIFSQKDFAGRPTEDKRQWSRVLWYNSLQGPLFLEQERSIKELCLDGSGIASDVYCYPSDSVDSASFGTNLVQTSAISANGSLDADARITPPRSTDYFDNTTQISMEDRVKFYNQPFHVVGEDLGRRLRFMRPEYSDRLSGSKMESGVKVASVFRAVFPLNVRYPLIQERLNYMWQHGWLDTRTKHISLRALMLNNEFSRPRLQSYKLVLSYSRVGDVFAKLTLDTIFLEAYSSTVGMAADGIFSLMLLFITIVECVGVVTNLRAGAFLKKAFTAWFLLEWLIIGVGWVVMFGYAYIAFLLGDVRIKMTEVAEARQRDFPAELSSLGVDLHISAGWVAYASTWHRLAVALYHLLLMFRFFVAFRAQPRLGVVINTLEACVIDVVHFIVILVPTFLAYAYAGMFVFGRRLEEFSNIRASVGICFRIMTESEFDWTSLSEEHVWTSMIWAWTFMIFLSLVMLNLVLAIFLEVYCEQRKMAGKSESIFGTIVSCWTRARHYKRWVSNETLIERLISMPRMFSRQELLKEFPTMPDKQMRVLLAEAQQLAANIHAGPEQSLHTMQMTLALKVFIDELATSIDELDMGTYVVGKEASPGKPLWLAQLAKELAAHNHGMLMLQWRLQQLNWAWQAKDIAHATAADGSVDSDDTFSL